MELHNLQRTTDNLQSRRPKGSGPRPKASGLTGLQPILKDFIDFLLFLSFPPARPKL